MYGIMTSVESSFLAILLLVGTFLPTTWTSLFANIRSLNVLMSLWFWKVLHKGDVLLGICALLNNAFESTTNMFLFALWPLIKQLCTGKSSINVLWCYPRKGLANYHARIIIKVSLPQHSASRSRLQCLYIYEVSSDFSTQNKIFILFIKKTPKGDFHDIY